jgi:hypothetical protein
MHQFVTRTLLAAALSFSASSVASACAMMISPEEEANLIVLMEAINEAETGAPADIDPVAADVLVKTQKVEIKPSAHTLVPIDSIGPDLELAQQIQQASSLSALLTGEAAPRAIPMANPPARLVVAPPAEDEIQAADLAIAEASTQAMPDT